MPGKPAPPFCVSHGAFQTLTLPLIEASENNQNHQKRSPKGNSQSESSFYAKQPASSLLMSLLMKSAVPVREAPPPESSVLMPFQPVNPHQQRFFRLPGRHSCDPRRTGGISPVNNSKSFCLEIGTWVRIPPSPPSKNPVTMRVSGFFFFCARSLAPPFPQKGTLDSPVRL